MVGLHPQIQGFVEIGQSIAFALEGPTGQVDGAEHRIADLPQAETLKRGIEKRVVESGVVGHEDRIFHKAPQHRQGLSAGGGLPEIFGLDAGQFDDMVREVGAGDEGLQTIDNLSFPQLHRPDLDHLGVARFGAVGLDVDDAVLLFLPGDKHGFEPIAGESLLDGVARSLQEQKDCFAVFEKRGVFADNPVESFIGDLAPRPPEGVGQFVKDFEHGG